MLAPRTPALLLVLLPLWPLLGPSSGSSNNGRSVAASQIPWQVPSTAPMQAAASSWSPPAPWPLATDAEPRSPYGRFLHITDLHPDTFYKHGTAVESACHHRKPKKSKKEGRWRAGWWGTGVSDCDAPPRLVLSALKWISQNWMPKASATAGDPGAIAGADFEPGRSRSRDNNSTAGLGFDFIIWTGDSARHDIDAKVPRTLPEIFELNRWTLKQIEDAFPGVPVVPSLGNNDIFPHNILFPGPNAIIKEFVRIWADHIPEYEFHTFEQGGYFVKELLANRLAAMSLNTLYFYDSNKAVDGCAKTKKRHGESDVDPGTAQLDWLEVQLDLLRRRKMQAHILGHVPPTAGNYFRRCYKRYTDIVLRYQDTVVGQHFGHMNTDVFFVQEDQEAVYSADIDALGAVEADEEDAAIEKQSSRANDDADDDDVEVMGDEGLPADLRQAFSSIPGRARTNNDYYSVFFTAPSIIPTYYPTFRVWTYNTSESERYDASLADAARSNETSDLPSSGDLKADNHDDGDLERHVDTASRHHHRPLPDDDGKKKHKHHRKKKKKKHGKEKPRHASADSPSRRNRYLSLLGYSQWVMEIDEQNKHIERILEGGADATTPLKGDKDKGKKEKRKEKKHDEGKDEEKRRHEAEQVEVDFRLMYTTYEARTLWQEMMRPKKVPEGTASVPVPRHLLERELDRLELDPLSLIAQGSDDDYDAATAATTTMARWKPPKALRKFTDYALPCITVDAMLDLGRRLVVDQKLWRRFVARIYTESAGARGKK